MDTYLQQLWREFSADPTIENYERLGVAYTRSGSRPRVIDIPARVLVADDTRATGRKYVCNLRDGAAIPADYFGDTLRETNHRIFARARELTEGIYSMRLLKLLEIVEHNSWRILAETFPPEALQDYDAATTDHVGILYVIDPFHNVIGWHARMTQPFYPSPTNIAEQIFINCDEEMKSIFRYALSDELSIYSRLHEESWNALKLLFIDIITA